MCSQCASRFKFSPCALEIIMYYTFACIFFLVFSVFVRCSFISVGLCRQCAKEAVCTVPRRTPYLFIYNKLGQKASNAKYCTTILCLHSPFILLRNFVFFFHLAFSYPPPFEVCCSCFVSFCVCAPASTIPTASTSINMFGSYVNFLHTKKKIDKTLFALPFVSGETRAKRAVFENYNTSSLARVFLVNVHNLIVSPNTPNTPKTHTREDAERAIRPQRAVELANRIQ